jgi:hypothetical protein
MSDDSAKDNSGWVYNPEGTAKAPADTSSHPPEQSTKSQKSITWTASEFIDVHKGAGWHFLFFGGLVLFGLAAFWFTKDYISSAVIIIAGIIFAVIINKKPRQLPYEINDRGIQIAERFYDYGLFKSFDLIQQDGMKSISLMPLKRLMPDISLYFPPAQESEIIDLLSVHLPHDEHVEKSVDRLARKLRF